MFATSDSETPLTPPITVVFKRSLKVYELPAEIWNPAVLVAKVHVAARPLKVSVALSTVGLTVLPFWSMRDIVELVKSVDVAALPVKVNVSLFKDNGPAEFAVRVTVPKSSGFAFERPLTVPSGAAVTASVVRNTVSWLPFAPEIETVVGRLDVAPNATTGCADVRLTESVVDATSN